MYIQSLQDIFFSQVRFGLVYISISINIYTTAFQNECQALTEPN